MKTVRPGKKVTVTAIFRDTKGELTDPAVQNVTLFDNVGEKVKTFKPTKLDVGLYKVIVEIPKDAKEGQWHFEWLAIIDGIPTRDITEIYVSKTKLHSAKLQIHLEAKNFIITFLGTKGNIEESSLRHRNTSTTIFYHRPHRILVDFGKRHDTLPEGITEVIITHAHPDHAFGLKGRSVNIPVYLNKFTHRLLNKENYPFRRKIFWKKPFRIGNVKVTPVPVLHSIKAPTSGLIFEANGRKIAYFPDVLDIRDKSVLKGADIYIGDGASLDRDIKRRKEGKYFGHASIRTQLQWLKDQGVPRAIFTHFGKWGMDSRIVRKAFKALSEEFGIRVAEAYDGHRIHIGRSIRLQRRLPGIYLKPPHAAHIAEGYKTIIVSAKKPPEDYMNRPIYFLQDNMVYGILTLTKVHGPLPAEDIRRMRDKHQITDEEWDKWWKDIRTMYYSEFRVERLYIPPKEFMVPQGVQKWITSVKLQRPSLDALQKAAEKQNLFAPVHHYGEKLGPKVTLKDFLKHWEKPIMLKKGYITVVGGLTNWGETEGDFDILQKEVEEIPNRDQPVLFRLGRALPPEYAKRLRRRFIGDYGGPFTSHVEVYDLVLVPATDRRLVHMQRIQALRDPTGRREALASLKEDKVKPLRFVAPLKGYKGYYKFPELAAKEIETEFKPEDYPIYAQKKYDGVIVVWMKDGDKIIARSDAGFDVTSRFPTLVNIAKRTWPKTVTVISETELWVSGVHKPREEMSGYLSARTPPDDSNVVSNVFDIVYFSDPKIQHHELPGDIGDLHKKPYELRYKYLKLIDFVQSTNGKPKVGQFNLTPSLLIHSPKEIQNALEKLAKFEASEGSVLKSSKGTYELDGLTHKQLKWKRMAEIHTIVLGKIETRTPNVYNLEIGVRVPAGWKVPKRKLREVAGKTYMYIGKTFNVAAPVKVGDITSTSFHTLNHYKVGRTGEQYITVYEPKFIEVRPTQKTPDSAEEAVEIARQKELLNVKRLQKFPMNDEPHKAVLQVHYRGKSAHMDFRIKVNTYLLGPTMFIAKPGAITESVETLAQAKTIERQWNRYFKLQDVPQTEITDPRRKIQVTWKRPEPKDWLTVQGVVPKGEVGATRYEYGVFSIVDRPTVYFGAQKPYYKEFFIKGKVMSGRWVIRYLPNPWKEERPREAFVFLMWKPESQTPYVLTKRAVDKHWIPPPNVSALPPEIRKNIPRKFKYWFIKNSSERLAIRDELVKALRKGEVRISGISLQNPPDIKEPRTAKAILHHRWFRGQFVRRGGPTEEYWDLFIEPYRDRPLMHFVLRKNPQFATNINGIFKESKEHKWLDIQETIKLKPHTVLNPTKTTPAFLEPIDRGEINILESGSQFIKLSISMRKLRGIWTLKKTDPRQNLWIMTKEEK